MLPQAGEICESCRKFWESQNLQPKYLVHVFNSEGVEIRTDNEQLEIIVCPYCDGDLILKLEKRL